MQSFSGCFVSSVSMHFLSHANYRRRKERRAVEKQQENMAQDVDDDDGAVSMTTTARTAGADTILDMLGDSDNVIFFLIVDLFDLWKNE